MNETRATETYRELGPVVYRRCLRLLGAREAAREATKAVFMTLLRAGLRLEDRDAVLPWAYRVATDYCLNRGAARTGAVKTEGKANAQLRPCTDTRAQNRRRPMTHVLVLAEEECIGLTCAEVLRRIGFHASAGSLSTGASRLSPDVIVAWEAARADLPRIHGVYGDVPILVCTWDSRQPWSDAVLVAPLPFNAERVALLLGQVLRRAKKPTTV